MGSLSIFHWLIVLVIVVLVFGTRKLPNIGKDLGGAVRSFRDGLKSSEPEKNTEEGGKAVEDKTSRVIDSETEKK